MSAWMKAALAAVAPALASAALAADPAFPTRPIRVIVPFGAGGSLDLGARPIARKLSEVFGVSVVVDNRPGANGAIGAELTMASPPDGHTLMMVLSGMTVISPAYNPKLSYDPVRDFTPIALMVKLPLVIVSHPSVPARNIAELVVLAKRNPGKLSYGHVGIGSANHLVGELFCHHAGIRMLHVPYKGGGQALAALLGGEIEVQVSAPNTMLPHVQSGRVRALATTGTKRLGVMPAVPTLVESGYSELGITGWFATLGPRGMQRPLVDRINSALRRAVESPEVLRVLAAEGMEPAMSSPDELGAFIKSELDRWRRAVAIAGIKPD